MEERSNFCLRYPNSKKMRPTDLWILVQIIDAALLVFVRRKETEKRQQ